MSNPDNSLGHRRVGEVCSDVADESNVDLQLVDGELAQVSEARVTGAEVVDRHLDPPGLQLLQGRDGKLRIRDERAFGELQLESVGGDAVRKQRGADLVVEVRGEELPR